MQNQRESIKDLVDRIILAVLDDLYDVEKSAEMKENINELHDEFRTIATRTVSQVLLRSTEIWEMASSSCSFPSSLASETDLDSMLEAMAQSGFPTDLMRSNLDSTSRDIIEIIEGEKITSGFRNVTLHRMIKQLHKKVKAFLTASKELVKKIGTEIKQYSESASSSQPSQMDDLTIRCTHDVIDGIIQVCHPNGGGEISEQGVQEVMQELSNITGFSRSSSENDVEVIDLEENNETSVPVIGEAATSHSRQGYESLLSAHFYQKVKRAVSDALHKTSAAVLANFSKTFEDITLEDLEVCDEQPGTSFKSSVLMESAVSDITETIVEDLKKVSSHNGSVTEPAPSRKTFRSDAKRLYKNVHFKVFTFLLRLQESHSETEETIPTSTVSNEDQSAVSISPPPQLVPRVQVQVGSCMEEVSVSSVVKMYKSEPVLSRCSCRRALSSAAPTRTTPVVEAVDRNVVSRNTAWATMNSSHETLSRPGDVSITPEDAHRSNPLFVFRRVKKCVTHLFTGANRSSTSHTSPVFAHTPSDRAENISNDNVSMDPDPATVKTRGVRFRKRLSRTFSAIRRALPSPFQCMTGTP